MSPALVENGNYKVVDTTLNHYLHPDKGGHTKYGSATASYFRRKFDEQPVKIADINGREEQFDLNTQGFQYHVSPTVGGDFRDAEKTKKEVYPETEKLLREVTGATRAKVFSHILRIDSREAAEEKVRTDPTLQDDDAPIADVTPARFVHIDQSSYGALEVLYDNVHPPELAEKLKKTRWSIINVWRPIKPILKDPLAMCDWRTLDENDLVTIPVVLPSKDSNMTYADISQGQGFELSYCKYNPAQTWYYRDGMKPGECLLIKCFDTINDGKTARKVPHSAFIDPTNDDTTTRESIEIRCLVFYEDQPLEG